MQYQDGKCIRLPIGAGRWHQDYCADPFLFLPKFCNGGRYLFYETLDWKDKGIIGCFKEEHGGWKQIGKVLERDYHLSYPQVFEDNGDIYMIPESCANGTVDLFRALNFPFKWEKVKTLIALPSVDSTLLRKDGVYYLALCVNGTAELWMADSLLGEWKRHPKYLNLNQSRRLRRNAGSFLHVGGQLYRVAQDCNGAYGKRVYRIPVRTISRTDYEEGPAELLLEGRRSQYRNGRHTYNILDDNCQLIAFDVQEWRRRPWYDALGIVWILFVKLLKKVIRNAKR